MKWNDIRAKETSFHHSRIKIQSKIFFISNIKKLSTRERKKKERSETQE